MRIFCNLMNILFLSFHLLACQSPTEQQNDTHFQWSVSLSANLIEGKFPKFVFKDLVICQGVEEGKATIFAIHKGTGKKIWEWNDLIDNHEIATGQIHHFQNMLVWRYAGRIYSINLDNGTTIWKERVSYPRGFTGFNMEVSGVGNTFIFTTGDPTYFMGSVLLPNIRQTAPIIEQTIASYSVPLVFVNQIPNLVMEAQRNDTLFILPRSTFQNLSYSIYHPKTNKILSNSSIDGSNSGVFGLAPILHNGKLYFPSGRFILCFDLASGKELWREQFPSIFSLSGIIYYDGMIIGNCEDTFMYALDANTGKQLWATKTSGTSSRLFEMNGVIYFTGGGDGLLHAVDAKTGKHIWKKESPDLARNGGAWFFDSVTGADGKIYVSSYLSLFCYKAAR